MASRIARNRSLPKLSVQQQKLPLLERVLPQRHQYLNPYLETLTPKDALLLRHLLLSA